MPRSDLSRLIRGSRAAIADLLRLLPGPAAVYDAEGELVLGDAAASGERHPIGVGDDFVGFVVGPSTPDGAGPASVAALVGHVAGQEREKRALADETLGRYKELALLYDSSERISKLLDLEQVAISVAEQAAKHLKASSAAVLVHDVRNRELEVVASVGDAGQLVGRQPDDVGLCGQVLRTGRSQMIESVEADAYRDGAGQHGAGVPDAVRALVCAPLRTGESVLGVLRITQDRPRAWTAGDLKLVTALGAFAASAISNARLHRERLRELALRHQVERVVSRRLLDAVFEDATTVDVPVAIAFCDLRTLAAARPDAPADEMMALVETGVALAAGAFLQGGAVVDTPQGELVVGVFRDDAAAAVRAADALAAELDRRGLGGLAGVGVVAATLPATSPQPLFAGINAAATLQSQSGGRVVVDASIAASLPAAEVSP